MNKFLNECHTLTEGVATLSGERLKSGDSRVKSGDAIKSQRPSDGHRDKIASLSPSMIDCLFLPAFWRKREKEIKSFLGVIAKAFQTRLTKKGKYILSENQEITLEFVNNFLFVRTEVQRAVLFFTAFRYFV